MATDELDLRGRIAVVTGAASGIGAASAARLADHGATVVVVDVDDERGRALVAELGAAHRYCHLDVSSLEDWERGLATVIAEHGRIDIVHLNAGVMARPKGLPLFDDPLEWFDEAAYRKVMGVNLDGVVLGLIAVVQHQELAPRIVITASLAGLVPLSMDPFYAASKHALIGLTRSLEPALRQRGIRLDVICPGAIDTAITAPDVRAAMHQEPPTLVADAVTRALASEPSEQFIWLAVTEARGVEPYTPPPPPGQDVAAALEAMATPAETH